MSENVSEEAVGMRAYQVRKSQAVSQAMDKIRQALSQKWSNLNYDQIDTLRWVLGDLWAFISHADWDLFMFSEIRLFQILEILETADLIVQHKKAGANGLKEVHNILKTITPKTRS